MGLRKTLKFTDQLGIVWLLMLVGLPPPVAAQEAVETLYVEVRQAIARGAARPWAPPVEKFSYGTAIPVVRREPGWVVTRLGSGGEIFISDSALTKKRVVLKSQSSSEGKETSLSGEDVVLAGKGFSQTIEGAFKTGEMAAQYAMLDRVEAQSISATELVAFLKAGGLVPRVDRSVEGVP